MELKPYTALAGICVVCALTSGGFSIAKNQASTNASQARTQALGQITNYRRANSCWGLKGNTPLVIGKEITLPTKGKSPTACFYQPLTQQYAYAGYLNGRLQTLYVFTAIEVDKGVKPNG